MTRSAAPATSTFDPPWTDASTPAAAVLARWATSVATSAARSASREPRRIRCPAAASRTARPRPCGPVPPSTPTTRSSTVRPSVTLRPSPGSGQSGATRPIMPSGGDGLVSREGAGSLAFPRPVLRGQLLLALGHVLHGVLRLLAGRVRAQPVTLGAAVAGLHRVVLETEEPGP